MIDKARLLARVDLAIAANGGAVFDRRNCECDADVGASPCRYCAIFEALNEVAKWLNEE